jgi:hypothetical protein
MKKCHFRSILKVKRLSKDWKLRITFNRSNELLILDYESDNYEDDEVAITITIGLLRFKIELVKNDLPF